MRRRSTAPLAVVSCLRRSSARASTSAAPTTQLVFGRRITCRTYPRFRTRVITDGVLPSPHVDCKRSHIKQNFKEYRALRIETAINNTYDIDVKRRLCNLDDLKEVGFKANRRLLDVQQISHDCSIGIETLDALHRPAALDNRRVSAMRFGSPRAQPVLTVRLMHVFSQQVGVLEGPPNFAQSSPSSARPVKSGSCRRRRSGAR